MVSIEDTLSDPLSHGSVLWFLLFILFTQPLTHVILTHKASDMLCADDTHVKKSCNVNDMDSVILYVEKCVSDIKTWMLSNKLQMNEDNTEVLLVTPKRVVKSEPFPQLWTSMSLLLNSAPHSGIWELLLTALSHYLGISWMYADVYSLNYDV